PTKVPFAEPLSRRIAVAPRQSISAWTRETRADGIGNEHVGERPIVKMVPGTSSIGEAPTRTRKCFMWRFGPEADLHSGGTVARRSRMRRNATNLLGAKSR